MSNIREADLAYERFISAERSGYSLIIIKCGKILKTIEHPRVTDTFYLQPDNKFFNYFNVLIDFFKKITFIEIFFIGRTKAIKLIDLRRVERVKYKGIKAIKLTHKLGTMVLHKTARWYPFYNKILRKQKFVINNPLDYKYLYWNVEDYLLKGEEKIE